MNLCLIKCSKLTIETLEQGVKYVQVNNKGTSVSIVNFEQVNAGWECVNDHLIFIRF